MATRTTPRRKPPAKKKKAVRRRGVMPHLERHHLDIIGLGLVAISVFFAFVVWLDWDGGQAGEAAVNGMKWLIGGLHVAVPLALMAAGAWLVLQPVLPAVRP